MKRIILVGFANSGKNTVGEYLINHHGYFGISFADSLKDVVASVFCWDRAMLEGDSKESRAWRETVDPWWANRLDIPDFSPRYAMRQFGTEVLRGHFNDAIWRLNVERRLEQAGDQPVVIIDGRFREEINLVTKTMGGTAIRVKRGEEPDYWEFAVRASRGDHTAKTDLDHLGIHRSEWEWIGYDFDIVIENNSTLQSLYHAVDAVIL